MPEETEMNASPAGSAFPAESLHVAAKSNSADSVKMLLRSAADPMARDAEGRTALEVAEAAGSVEAVELLREAGGATLVNEEPPGACQPASPAGVCKSCSDTGTDFLGNACSCPRGALRGEPAVRADLGGAGSAEEGFPLPMASADSTAKSPDANAKRASPKPSTMAKSASAGASVTKGGMDIKKRLQSTSNSTDNWGGFGEDKASFARSFGNFKSSPKFTFTERGKSSFIRVAYTPAPGSYNLPEQDRDKFKAVPRFSFGVSSRFGLGTSPLKLQPGPGAYDPHDPAKTEPKIGFGTSKRGRGTPMGVQNPGPGAYELKSCLGEGRAFTARGRLATSYLRSRSAPGPGAYNPTAFAARTSPKCGFGTSTRGELASRTSAGMPGPGAYELQNYGCLGKDSAKPSMTSRRKMHDLNSYTAPGPGSYNSHITSFEPKMAVY